MTGYDQPWGEGGDRRDGCFHGFVSEILLAAARGMVAPRFPERNLENLSQRVCVWGHLGHRYPALSRGPSNKDGTVKQLSFLKSLLAFDFKL